MTNYADVILLLRTLVTLLRTKFREDLDSWTHSRIDKFVTEQEDNLVTNQTRMLNSLLNRQRDVIVIDRLMIPSLDDSEPSLTRDPVLIEDAVISHFQNIGCDVNNVSSDYTSIMDILQDWHQFYYTKSVDSKLQQTLILPICFSELKETIKMLPKGKAAGPNQISYEDISHLHDKILSLVLTFLIVFYHKDTFPINENMLSYSQFLNQRLLIII